MKPHKSPRKPGMHSVHDSKGSGARTMHAQQGISTKTIIIIVASIVVFLVLMYLMMAG
ncbi:MAG: hypothetical protein SFV55_21160 [Haliscomenobacter sp.]|uniref:hypothetical protein n=1 Tax=Haliscomenobacter sp. TaxID=2717303 RepID=UPI0029BED6E1|nr:hypothetical protein [Haliscomenobacter sp.]MDX2070952.1 hypothetical protein [Haliscomenobacter sp.]